MAPILARGFAVWVVIALAETVHGALRNLLLVPVVGGLWLVLMLTFEIGLGRTFGLSWERIRSDYDPAQGGLLSIGMAVVFLSPVVAGKVRGPALREQKP